MHFSAMQKTTAIVTTAPKTGAWMIGKVVSRADSGNAGLTATAMKM